MPPAFKAPLLVGKGRKHLLEGGAGNEGPKLAGVGERTFWPFAVVSEKAGVWRR